MRRGRRRWRNVATFKFKFKFESEFIGSAEYAKRWTQVARRASPYATTSVYFFAYSLPLITQVIGLSGEQNSRGSHKYIVIPLRTYSVPLITKIQFRRFSYDSCETFEISRISIKTEFAGHSRISIDISCTL